MANDTAPTSSNSGEQNETQAITATYTKFNLSAVAFVHPPSPPDIKQCLCESLATPQTRQGGNKFIRVYHTEPSVDDKGWHAHTDDLVADDAASGSPVVAVGWWQEEQVGGHETWETRVYYIDRAGDLRERTNRTLFGPAGVKDDFDLALPEPVKLVPPTPGWQLTPLKRDVQDAAPATVPFPKITPLPGSKLSALRVDGGNLKVFYQATDGSIQVLEYSLENTAWDAEKKTVVGPGQGQARLTGAYGDAHTSWREIEALPYHLAPSAMISAVAWNYASNFFEIRVYTTDDSDALYEMSYSRHLDGWKPHTESVAPVLGPGTKSPALGSHGGPPLSAVAAVLLEGEWKTKVYFHPRRTIGEWDVCAKAPAFGGIPKVSAAAAERRDLEEKTRVLIKAEEERKRKAEEERRAREAEERREREEEQRRALPPPKPAPALILNNPIVIMGSLTSAPQRVDDHYERLDNLPFPISLYGHTTKTVWITENGAICLDDSKGDGYYSDKLSFKYRDAKPLPFAAADFSKYALFPLWADLEICEGGKHGVFYQVSGTAPARTLTVEWLVTQYGAHQDYYHFIASLEEARPGRVTFKYNAVDGSAGSKCTVGLLQGGGRYIQFSYNGLPQKIEPGLQIEFDTTAGTYTTTRFTPTARS